MMKITSEERDKAKISILELIRLEFKIRQKLLSRTLTKEERKELVEKSRSLGEEIKARKGVLRVLKEKDMPPTIKNMEFILEHAKGLLLETQRF